MSPDAAVTYGVTVATHILIGPAFGLRTTLAQKLKTGEVLTVVSIALSFALRRKFEGIRVWTIDLGIGRQRC